MLSLSLGLSAISMLDSSRGDTLLERSATPAQPAQDDGGRPIERTAETVADPTLATAAKVGTSPCFARSLRGRSSPFSA